MRTLNYFPCKICHSTNEEKIVPVAEMDPKTFEILSVDCQAFESIDEETLKKFGLESEEQLENCEATIFENNQILCYKCAEEFYFDGATRVCRPSKDVPALRGCSVTYDNQHCVLCVDKFQMDLHSGRCQPDSDTIDLSKYDQFVSPGTAKLGKENSINSNTVQRDNDLFQTTNSFSDDTDYDNFDDSDQMGQSDFSEGGYV